MIVVLLKLEMTSVNLLRRVAVILSSLLLECCDHVYSAITLRGASFI